MSSDYLRALRVNNTPQRNSLAVTTASQNSRSWLQPPASAGPTPQPVFTQDFDLFQPSATPTPVPSASPRRAPSLDSTRPHLFNPAATAEGHGNVNLYSGQTVNSTQLNQRQIRPVPFFHSNSNGSLANTDNTQYQQQVTDLANFDMGGGGNSNSCLLAHDLSLKIGRAHV